MGADELLLAQSWLRSRRSITAAIEWRDTIVWFATLKRMDGSIVGLLLSSRQCRSPPGCAGERTPLEWPGIEESGWQTWIACSQVIRLGCE
jgi:hypothetical protein